MSGQVLLIDLENVQTVDLSLAPGDVCVLIFYGVTQQKLPEELVVQAQPLGTRLDLERNSHHHLCPSQRHHKRENSVKSGLQLREELSWLLSIYG